MSNMKANGADLTSTEVQQIKDDLGVVPSAPKLFPAGTTFVDATAHMTKKKYLFGTSVTAGSGEIAITNNTQLGTYFNPYAGHWDGSQWIGTGLADINSELQRYTAFGSGNHVFGTNKLTLQPVIGTGTYQNVAIHKPGGAGVIFNVFGDASPAETIFANLVTVSGISASALEVGQMGAHPSGWVYVKSKSGTGVTLEYYLSGNTSRTTVTANLPIIWTKFACARVGAGVSYGWDGATAGTSIPVRTVIPSWVTSGYAIYHSEQAGWNCTRFKDQKIASIAGDRLSYTADVATGNLNGSAGGIVVFGPSLTSGQLWSKDLFKDYNTETECAVEVEFSYTPGLTTSYSAGEYAESHGGNPAYSAEDVNTLINTTYPNEPLGLFDSPLWTWPYAKTWEASIRQPWDEFDFEIFGFIYKGSKNILMNIHTEKLAEDSSYTIIRPSQRSPVYKADSTPNYTGTKWEITARYDQKKMFDTINTTALRVAVMDGGVHKFSRKWNIALSVVDEFIDGIHVSRTKYNNSGAFLPSQLGITRAVAALETWRADGHFFPRSNAQATIGMNIHSVSFYSK